MREKLQGICVKMCVEIAWNLRGKSAHTHAYKHNEKPYVFSRVAHANFTDVFDEDFTARFRRFHGQIRRPDCMVSLLHVRVYLDL